MELIHLKSSLREHRLCFNKHLELEMVEIQSYVGLII